METFANNLHIHRVNEIQTVVERIWTDLYLYLVVDIYVVVPRSLDARISPKLKNVRRSLYPVDSVLFETVVRWVEKKTIFFPRLFATRKSFRFLYNSILVFASFSFTFVDTSICRKIWYAVTANLTKVSRLTHLQNCHNLSNRESIITMTSIFISVL